MPSPSQLAQARARAEAQMVAECTITRGGVGEPVLNEETGLYDTPAAAAVYQGICDLKFVSAVVREIDAQNQGGVEQEPVLKLPIAGSEDVQVNDVATITAHQHDAGMVGVKVRVAGIHGGSVTARRFPVEATS